MARPAIPPSTVVPRRNQAGSLRAGLGASALLLGTLLSSGCGGRNAEGVRGPLFPMIAKDGRMGFIDTSGRVVIEPRFHAVGDFSEGLAAAREGGLYGYIDATGEYAIAPRWDYATEFHYGRAVVYEDSVPVVIDRAGRRIAGGAFVEIEPFEHGVARVRARSQRVDRASCGQYTPPASGGYGLIDTTGRLLLDTTTLEIRPFIEGLAVVELSRDPRVDWVRPDVAVVDTTGRFVIPPGRFLGIRDLDDGLFAARWGGDPDGPDSLRLPREVYVGKDGRIVHVPVFAPGVEPNGELRQGRIPVRVAEMRTGSDGRREEVRRAGYADASGRVLFSDTGWSYARNFQDGRAFVGTRNDGLRIIDTSGRPIPGLEYRSLGWPADFEAGRAIVLVDQRFAVIDTNGRFLVAPSDRNGRFRDPPSHLVFTRLPGEGFHYRFNPILPAEGQNAPWSCWWFPEGLLDGRGRRIVPPIMNESDSRGFRHGLFAFRTQGRLTYVDTGGRIVWQQAPIARRRPGPMNIDFQLDDGSRVTSADPRHQACHEWDFHPNPPKRIPFWIRVPADSLSVVVRPWTRRRIRGRYLAMTVHVANTTSRTMAFPTQRGRLAMRMQALDPQGLWRDIEDPWPWQESPRVDGGRPLQPGEYWSVDVPVYEGSFRTKLRLELEYIDSGSGVQERRWGGRDTRVARSRAFYGSVNPGQFWRDPRSPRTPYAQPHTVCLYDRLSPLQCRW